MTVRLLIDYLGQPANSLITLAAATETGLVNAKMASTNLTGGTTYVAPTPQTQYIPANLVTDANGNTIAVVGTNRTIRRFPLTSGTLKRAIAGKMRLANNLTNPITSHQQFVLAAPAYAFRLGIFNLHTATIAGVKAAVAATDSFDATGTVGARDPSTGVWVNATFGGAASGTLAAGAAVRPKLTWTDWIELATIDRNDGYTLPTFMLRIEIPTDATNCYHTVLDIGSLVNLRDQTLISGGRVHRGINQSVLGVTTPANFTTVSGTNDPIAVVVEYVPLVRGRTVMCIGDSTVMGSGGTIPAYGDMAKAVYAASTPDSPVELCNLAWGGANTSQYYLHALDTLADITPDHLLYAPFSPNDGTPTAALVETQKQRLARVIAQCETRSVDLTLVNGIPSTPGGTSGLTWGAADAFRVAFNAAMSTYGYPVYDRSSIVSGATDGSGQVLITPAYTTDNLHLDDDGYNATVPALRAAVGI